MRAGYQHYTRAQSQSPVMNDNEGRQDFMEMRDTEPVVSSVATLATTPATGKHKNRTSKNFTCSAKEDLELEEAVCHEQPALSGPSQDHPVDSGVKGTQRATLGDHPGQPFVKTSLLRMTPSRRLPQALDLEFCMTPGTRTSTPLKADEPGHTQIPESAAPAILGASGSQGTPVQTSVKVCKHVRGGMCLVHRKKATKKTKSSWMIVVGPDGKSTKKCTKKTYWQCDVGLDKSFVLKQTQLSFKQPVVVERGGADVGGMSVEDFSSSTVGQAGDVQTGESM